MEMDDELENFIRERKARVAEDKARLEQDPPYMEMKAKPHRSYESTVKENIPPSSVAQGKEESVGLPLGVEYERKKQRLQRELRMDYRRYIAEKKHFDSGPFIPLDNKRSVKQRLLEDLTGVLPKQQISSRRDAATLTEEHKGLQRALRLTEVKTLCPEEEDEQPPLALKYHNRLRRPVEQELEDGDYSEELELMEGRRMGTDTGYERRRTKKTDGREKKENPVSFVRDGRRSRALTKNDDAEFATGLIIGADDTDETVRRRKERYRQELQEQIAEQHRNKKREKDLELKVAATGANDPEKQPDRIRQFGLSRRRNLHVLQSSATEVGESSSRGISNRERIGLGKREMPPPEQPHVAFQSPLLDYSSALGLGGSLSPNGPPAPSSFHRATDTPRIPVFPPHPPSALSEASRNLYTEPHCCYGSRNLLDRNMAYCGHLSVPGAGLPMSCWNMLQGGAVPSQFGNHSPHSQYSGSSFPDPPTQSSNEAPVNSPVRGFPAERSRSTRERILSYRDALKEQILEQQERRRLEKEERERYEAQLEADMKNHQPWGRGGGGAPLRDDTGNLIADLNQMHKLNEEAYINPEQWQRKTMAAMTARQPEQPDPNERVSGFTHVQTSQFARGKVFANQPTQQQLQEQDKYKAFLKQQIEEKMRKKAEEKERTRLEEEKEEKRLAEQRARIQREYEEEQARKKQKEKEQKAKNEELIQQAEERKREAERKKKDVEEKENAELKRRYERDRQARVEEVCREPSPPIPTLQKKRVPHHFIPRPPTVDSQHSTVPLSEHSLSGLQSPPVPARRTQLRAACDQRDVFSELSALRRQLRSEQKRLESHLQQDDWEELDSPLSDRHGERPPVDVFDMARLRLQAPVRRPNSRNMEPSNLLRIHDSLQLKYRDAKSRLDSTEVPKLEEVGLTSRRRQDYKETYHQLSNHRSTAQDDYFDLSPTHQNYYLRSVMGRSARGSLLESESAFIDPLGNAFPVPRTPECEKPPQLSARERRRLAKQSQYPQEGAASIQCRGQHDSNTGPVDLSDDDSSPPLFSLHSDNHQSSRESAVTDSWMRLGTSDTQKSLDHPSRRKRSAM